MSTITAPYVHPPSTCCLIVSLMAHVRPHVPRATTLPSSPPLSTITPTTTSVCLACHPVSRAQLMELAVLPAFLDIHSQVATAWLYVLMESTQLYRPLSLFMESASNSATVCPAPPRASPAAVSPIAPHAHQE